MSLIYIRTNPCSSPFQSLGGGGFHVTLSVCLSTASTLTSWGGPVGASSAVMIVTVSEGSDVPSSFSATILMWYVVAGRRLNTPASAVSPGTRTLFTKF